MKNLLTAAFTVLLLCTVATSVFATAPGPSDATSPPPTSASAVGQVLCFGSTITLQGPQDVGGVNYARYQWYKLDNAGVKQLVKDATSDNIYTEASAGAGYYTYQLVITNASGCSSDISDAYQIYVLPQLAPTITATTASICSNNATTTTLTANANNTNFTYTYQWTRNGTNIAGATNTTYTATETAAGSVTFGVIVAYTLNNTCTQTATQVITVVAVPGKPSIVAVP